MKSVTTFAGLDAFRGMIVKITLKRHLMGHTSFYARIGDSAATSHDTPKSCFGYMSYNENGGQLVLTEALFTEKGMVVTLATPEEVEGKSFGLAL